MLLYAVGIIDSPYNQSPTGTRMQHFADAKDKYGTDIELLAGLVLEPLPTGAWAFLAVTTAIFTKTLTFGQAFGAFTNDVIWLIVVSFFFAAVSVQCCSRRDECSQSIWHDLK